MAFIKTFADLAIGDPFIFVEDWKDTAKPFHTYLKSSPNAYVYRLAPDLPGFTANPEKTCYPITKPGNCQKPSESNES